MKRRHIPKSNPTDYFRTINTGSYMTHQMRMEDNKHIQDRYMELKAEHDNEKGGGIVDDALSMMFN